MNILFCSLDLIYLYMYVFKPFSVLPASEESEGERDKIALCVFNKESHFLDLPRNLCQIKSYAERNILKFMCVANQFFERARQPEIIKIKCCLATNLHPAAPSFGPLAPGA
jgi:hypothetical protein